MQSFFNVSLYVVLGTYLILLIAFITLKSTHVKVLHFIFIPLLILHAILKLILLPKELDYTRPSNYVVFYIVFVILLATVIVIPLLFDKNKFRFDTRSISYAGICIATAFALSFIKIEFLGGSVTLASALPIILYSYMYGAKKGTFIGVIFGLLQFLQKSTIYHPIQVVIDYPLAFAGIGLSGILKDYNLKPIIKFIAGAFLGLIFRYVAHVVSGYFIFGTYAGDYGFNSPLLYSIVFNMNVLVDLAIVLAVGIFIFSSKSFVKTLDKTK